MPAPSHSEAPNFNPVVWWSTIAGICAVILFGSIFPIWSYRKKRQQEIENPRPAYLEKLSDFNAVNRDGKKVSLSQLKGKIWVAGYQYTDCPAACLGMAAVMKTLHEEFGSRDDFHLVSVSLNPSEDTPGKMDAWVKAHGVDADNWWFLTGDEKEIRDFMIRDFKLFGVQENTDPAVIAAEGKFSHDQRLALVDGLGNLRGVYAVLDTEWGTSNIERLDNDIRYLYREAGKELPPGGAEPASRP